MRWFDELQKKMAAVPAKYLIVDAKVEPGERVVGTLSESTLRVYGLCLQMDDELKAVKKRHTLLHQDGKASEENCEEFHAATESLRRQAEIIIGIFWEEVRLECGIQGEIIGVRSGGRVVVLPEQRDPLLQLADLLANVVVTAGPASGKRPNHTEN